MSLEQKGMVSPFTVATSVITGGLFPLLGGLFAYSTGVLPSLDNVSWLALGLTSLGGFLAHYLLSHTIHDLFHYDLEERATLSRRMLKMLLLVTLLVLLVIAVFLTLRAGWPVMVFAGIGAVVCMYAEGLLHSEAQMAFGAMFLVIGSFYVQVGSLHHGLDAFTEVEGMIWLKVVLLSLFAFFSQYGWLLFYRLDDYGWSPRVRNQSILLAKLGLPFLILALALPVN